MKKSEFLRKLCVFENRAIKAISIPDGYSLLASNYHDMAKVLDETKNEHDRSRLYNIRDLCLCAASEQRNYPIVCKFIKEIRKFREYIIAGRDVEIGVK